MSLPYKRADREDMFETMYEANGVGLAAPQVGILKRIVVIDRKSGYQVCTDQPEIIELGRGADRL